MRSPKVFLSIIKKSARIWFANFQFPVEQRRERRTKRISEIRSMKNTLESDMMIRHKIGEIKITEEDISILNQKSRVSIATLVRIYQSYL